MKVKKMKNFLILPAAYIDDGLTFLFCPILYLAFILYIVLQNQIKTDADRINKCL